jgi:hypothetical protein
VLGSIAPVPVARQLPSRVPDPVGAETIRLAEDDVVQAALKLDAELSRVGFLPLYPDEMHSVSAAQIHAPLAAFELRDALRRRFKVLNGC